NDAPERLHNPPRRMPISQAPPRTPAKRHLSTDARSPSPTQGLGARPPGTSLDTRRSAAALGLSSRNR
ncbi:unnamed protein product, partial [Ixodes hexagonus]